MPEGVLPADGHEPEVHPVQPAPEHVHDQNVSDGENEQKDAGHSHEHPPPELAALSRRLAAGPVGEARAQAVTVNRAGRSGWAAGVDGHQKYFTTIGFTIR